MKQFFKSCLAIFALLLICAACSRQPSSIQNKKKPSDPESTQTISHQNDSQVPKKDGTVISLKEVKVPNTNFRLATYRMMYWSEGKKVEAYVAAPHGQGMYALQVVCHGGYAASLPRTHVKQLDDVHFDETLIAYASPYQITVAPLYKGYGNSEGTVEGLHGYTMDTENAIKAIKTYFNNHEKYPNIQDGHLYLQGVSMGGGVVLNIASERQDVLSVVAISPFVGWDIFGNYCEEHQDNPIWKNYLDYAVRVYGQFNINLPAYKEQSIDYKKITAPVFLIQGTADKNVPWETVQTLYKKMKKNKQRVTIKLVDGGNHALSNKEDLLNQALTDWYDKNWHG
ncbi:dienelactone hydrolase [Pullulanibacillus pueri]|uniref:Peptidase S9 prolyl oligopeptidase catalytic domain-containing protein n=1 Tax=Pullulanibacillus pueri TaxID=1437324 RepID=A0A8J3EL02_9BACL|nr:dienelactone hydrolase family protein [Pullulanibacillus pueri]MBM7681123.1 dienelactone hydrolase [Pullulanibacillus pueri]GGH77133.1 hypothetical protein GCM10007096_08580 [Pullulanibacillus pueri]